MKNTKRLFLVLLLVLSAMPFAAAAGGSVDKKTVKEFEEKIENLNIVINEKNFIVENERILSAEESKRVYVADMKSLIQFRVKFFYTFGKMHGYAIFTGRENDYAVIDNARIKITLHHPVFQGNKRIFYVDVDKESFRELTLARGDRVIAFPIRHVRVGDFNLGGRATPVEAECFHLKTSTIIIPFG